MGYLRVEDAKVAAPFVCAVLSYLLEVRFVVGEKGVEALERRGEGVVALAADRHGFCVGVGAC